MRVPRPRGIRKPSRPRYAFGVDDSEKLEALLELARAAELEIRSVGLRAAPAVHLGSIDQRSARFRKADLMKSG